MEAEEKEKIIAAYRNAGELYGHLQLAMTFGDLEMHQQVTHILIQWQFAHGEHKYANTLCVGLKELATMPDCKAFAKKTSEGWNRSFRRLTELKAAQ